MPQAQQTVEPPPAPPVLQVDDQGFFVAPETPSGAWFPGPGVDCLLPLPGVPGGPLCGRVASGEATPTLYRKGSDGKLEPVECIVAGASPLAPPRSAVGAALRDHGVRNSGYGPYRDLARVLSPPLADGPKLPPPAPAEPVEEAGPVPDPGTPFAAWVPDDLVFVRFRSIAAAMRFVGLADGIGSILEARAGRGRDYGTLRLTLHDLLLPSIWNTNPEAETGVGEVALALAPPTGEGPLRAAVLLRITDPELHHMQTQAALSYEAREDHLWRPDDDPFPQLRERNNHRKLLGDVEVVSTDAGLLARFPARSPVQDDRYWERSREENPVPTVRGRSEALYLFVARAARGRFDRAGIADRTPARRALREERGLRWLVEAWSGVSAGEAVGALAERSDAMPWWAAGVRSVHVATDIEGGHTTVDLLHEATAIRLAGALGSPQVPAAQVDAACGQNLVDVAAPALLEAPTPSLAERVFVVLGWRPVCPSGGTYTAHPVTREVRCSAHGTAGDFRPGAGGRLPVADLVRDGSRVTFRLEIDWTRRE